MAEEKKTVVTKEKVTDPREKFKKMNIWQKLLIARKMFLAYNKKPSGFNDHAGFDYFELGDIVPAVTEIFNEVGLIAIERYDESEFKTEVIKDEHGFEMSYKNSLLPKMHLTLTNTDKPEEFITFSLPFTQVQPIVSKQGKQVTNEIQALGATVTYLRRYLYMLCMDVVQRDEIDLKSSIFSNEPKTEKPKTAEERKDIVKEQTAPDNKADEQLVAGVRRAIKTLLEKAKGTAQAENIQTKLDTIVVKTGNLNNMTKEQAEKIIESCRKEMVKLDGMAK